ncbi:methyltransferase domain-containing protein [Actinomadura decatromicini]|uniref:Methyltransferase domain-containing protein n=1 Tax=Actinomadura decatromicini TaxID=2604572 RepID=A0A5D3FU16_9ACTN|nr:methyltransferase domain-containing protein [Actinomadura decatromicini]TYK52337.1 methyltransferase domain-containing protein [Actinomadura decatromicini]
MTMVQSPIDRLLALLREEPTRPDVSQGFLDLLPPETPRSPSLAQSVMETSFLPKIYERIWRPIGFNVAKGWPLGPDTATEQAMARDWLALSGGPATVLDVACGPGNVTRALSKGVGEGGLLIGLDASRPMLTRAAEDTTDPKIQYVRGDATDLPFRDATFDAVSCFGALYLFKDPWAAIDAMTRVLKPGGHLTILASRHPAILPTPPAARSLLRRATGYKIFGDKEITAALRDRGFQDLKQHRYPFMQLVGASRPQ